MLDLTAFKKSFLDSATVSIVNPVTGDKLGIEIELASPDSSKYRAKSLEVMNKQLERNLKAKNKTATVEQLENNGNEVLAGATISWSGLGENGKELPCTYENALHVYSEYKFIKEQVDEFLGDRKNFFKG